MFVRMAWREVFFGGMGKWTFLSMKSGSSNKRLGVGKGGNRMWS